MCVPQDYINIISDSALNIVQGFKYDNDSKKQYENYNYRKQIAINNALIEQDNAHKAMQEGIESSRKEKLQSIQEANKLKVRNSASGFSLNSDTSQEQYDDIISQGEIIAKNELDLYNEKANNYYSRANGYLEQADEITRDYNSSLYNSAMIKGYLGNANKVAQNWYKDMNN